MVIINPGKDKWPVPRFNEHQQPHFIFLISPPYSGTTAISEILNTSNRITKLQEHAEGQWLVPGLCEKDRWSPKKYVDYNSVRAVWLHRYQNIKQSNPDIHLVIEKSPPNMVRIENLLLQFDDYSLIANNRNPYAYCSSVLHRNNNANTLTPDERIFLLENIIRSWVKRSEIVRDLIERLNIPLLTYEKFCSSPELILNIINLPDDIKKSISPNAKIQVKDYKPQVVTSQNNRQISKLDIQEIKHIRTFLESSEKLLDYFDYELQ